MRKKYISILIAVVVLAGWVYFAVSNVGEVKITQAVEEKGKLDADEDDGTKMKYMVKEYYGNIGIYIFAQNEYVLASIKDFDVSKLPEADIDALREGIFLENKEDMLHILEDYTS